MNKKECYEILNVSSNADIKEIEDNYNFLYNKYKKAKAYKKIVELMEAYNLLLSKINVSNYDNDGIVSNFYDKIKNFIILILVLIIVFGGSYVSSEISYYKKNCQIESNTEVENMFSDISIEEYKNLLSGENLSFIYIGRNDCEYSKAEDVVLQEILSEYNIIINYLNLNKLTDYDLEYLYSSYSSFIDDGIATPTITLVQGGEVKMFKKGYTSKDNLIELLTENNFI